MGVKRFNRFLLSFLVTLFFLTNWIVPDLMLKSCSANSGRTAAIAARSSENFPTFFSFCNADICRQGTELRLTSNFCCSSSSPIAAVGNVEYFYIEFLFCAQHLDTSAFSVSPWQLDREQTGTRRLLIFYTSFSSFLFFFIYDELFPTLWDWYSFRLICCHYKIINLHWCIPLLE